MDLDFDINIPATNNKNNNKRFTRYRFYLKWKRHVVYISSILSSERIKQGETKQKYKSKQYNTNYKLELKNKLEKQHYIDLYWFMYI